MVESMLKEHPAKSNDLFTMSILLPMLVLPFVLASWSIAIVRAGRLPRPWRLAIGVMAGAGIVVFCVPPIVELLGFDLTADRSLYGESEVMIPSWAYWTASFLDVTFFTGIGVAVLETYRRRTSAQRALGSPRQEQTRLTRGLLESRLAAMQRRSRAALPLRQPGRRAATYDRDADRGARCDGSPDHLPGSCAAAVPRIGFDRAGKKSICCGISRGSGGAPRGYPVARFTAPHPSARPRAFRPCCFCRWFRRPCAVLATRQVPRSASCGARSGQRRGRAVACRGARLVRDDAELARVRDRLAGCTMGRSRLSCESRNPE